MKYVITIFLVVMGCKGSDFNDISTGLVGDPAGVREAEIQAGEIMQEIDARDCMPNAQAEYDCLQMLQAEFLATYDFGKTQNPAGTVYSQTQTDELMVYLDGYGCWVPGLDEFYLRVYLEGQFYDTYQYGKAQ